MKLFDRFIQRPLAPSGTKRVLPELCGVMTAHQAWATAAPIVKAMDRQARLTFIASGLDLNEKGCSLSWEFIFILPERNVNVVLSLEPDPQSEDVDGSPCILIQRINQAAAIDASRPTLPDGFRDSPDVVAEFIAHGVDFVAGPSDIKLEGRVLPSGEAVWVTYYWDQEYSTSFLPKCG
ncbi:hypothetical protein [Cyanobium sp. CH-040]|uniref:hypothetical protein n=1 Tax=Cyanobium sp. CH-040 TaxID=2823708 RepID=UPI0020CE53A5|nr:hypothetical protein [Cyanobium sp. CH-040]MCP9927493.1 hypothetical protein [Cyanobium sp. CH-040]